MPVILMNCPTLYETGTSHLSTTSLAINIQPGEFTRTEQYSSHSHVFPPTKYKRLLKRHKLKRLEKKDN